MITVEEVIWHSTNRHNLLHICPNTGYCCKLLDLRGLNRQCQMHASYVPLKAPFGRKTGVDVRREREVICPN